MTAAFDQWGVAFPATTQRPQPTEPGMVVHSVTDLSMYAGNPATAAYGAAETEEEKAAALEHFPLATVRFYQIPEGESFFDDPDDDLSDHPDPPADV